MASVLAQITLCLVLFCFTSCVQGADEDQNKKNPTIGMDEVNVDDFKDLECIHNKNKGFCWPQTDCNTTTTPTQGAADPCITRADVPDAVCCPVADKAPETSDVNDREVWGPHWPAKHFVSHHNPWASEWTWKRWKGGRPHWKPPVWRPHHG